MRSRNYTKFFSIVGFVFGEIIMLYTVLAPKRKGAPIPINIPVPLETFPADMPIPLGARILEVAVSSVYFGLFGALVGLGIGLLVTGFLAKRPPPANRPPPPGAP